MRPSRVRRNLSSPPGALELMGMGIAPDHDGGALGHAQIALAQLDALAFGQLDQLLDRPVGEPRIGRMRNRLLLHGGVHHHALEILGLDRPGPMRHRKALLQQRRNLLLAQPLAPARQRRAIERRLVAEHHFAAEVLKIRVLHPAVAQRLVGEIVHVLEDEQPGHQPRRQRRLPRPGATDRTEPSGQETPIDLRRQPHQRMAKVDDLLQSGPQTDHPDDRRVAGSSALPRQRNPRRQRNHEPPKSGIPKRKKTETHPGFLAKSNTCSGQITAHGSIASEFFTGDSLTPNISTATPASLIGLKIPGSQIQARDNFAVAGTYQIKIARHLGNFRASPNANSWVTAFNAYPVKLPT